MKSHAKVATVITQQKNVSKATDKLGFEAKQMSTDLAAWGVDEGGPIGECFAKLADCDARREAALAALMEKQEEYAGAFRDIRERLTQLDEAMKRHKKAEESLAKAEKKSEKAKPGPKKDEAEAEIAECRSELSQATDVVTQMTLTCERYKHQRLREASLQFSEALSNYHEECAAVANKSQLIFAAIPDVVSMGEDGAFVYRAVGEDAPAAAASSGGAAPAAGAASGTAAAAAAPAAAAAGAATAAALVAKNTISDHPNSFASSVRVQCTAGGQGAQACGRYHVFALNPTGSSKCRADCRCSCLISLDVRDAATGFFLGTGVQRVDEEDMAGVAADLVDEHPGAWKPCDFFDDPWAERWEAPTAERVRRGRDAPPFARLQGEAIRAYVPQRADQVKLAVGDTLIIADDVNETWYYGMVVAGEFGFIRKTHVTVAAALDPYEQMRQRSASVATPDSATA